MTKFSLKTLVASSLVAASVLAPTAHAEDTEVNIYSYRQPFLIQPLLDAFTEETGITTNVLYASKGIVEKLEREGRNSPADVLLTSDIGALYQATTMNLLQPIESQTLETNIPAQYQDPQNRWFGLTARSRIIYASKDRVKDGEISTYEDLADPKWEGRICTRSGKHTYSLSLIASMIAEHGEEKAGEWLSAVKNNLARKPQGNDRAQVKAVKDGVCDIALGNTYYFGKMLTNQKEPEQIEWAKSVNLVFPNQQERGAHMNVSGAGVTANAPHKEAAIKLIEFLSGEKAQEMYAASNFEFPVRPNTQWSPLLVEYMGEFKADDINLQTIGELRKPASKLVDKVGFEF
ncbi:MAG: Fe(3+) ABC transporter substrate-binding protein [Pontibacterium sp.]